MSADKAPNYSKYQTEFGNFGGHVNTISPGRTTSFNDQVAWLKGRHSMKFGFEFMRVNYRRIDCNSCVGVVTTSNASTANPTVANSGINYASFLLGLANSANFSFGADINFIFRYYAWYYQDDIKINNKLTLNVGLRYDLPFPRLEEHRQNSNFNPSIPNPGRRTESSARSNSPAPGPGRSGRDILQYVQEERLRPAPWICLSDHAEDGGPRRRVRSPTTATARTATPIRNIQGFGGSFSAVGSYLSSGIAFQFKDGFNVTPDLVNAARPVHIDPAIGINGSPSFKSWRVRQARLFLRLQLHPGTELRPEHAAARQLPRQLRDQAAAEPEPEPARSEVLVHLRNSVEFAGQLRPDQSDRRSPPDSSCPTPASRLT